MVVGRRPAIGTLAFVSLLACGDDHTAPGPGGGEHDAATDAPDAAPTSDAATLADAAPMADAAGPDDLVVFVNEGGAFAWDCTGYIPDVGYYEPGRVLDLRLPAAMQSGEPSRSLIGCYKLGAWGNETAGGIWFYSWRDPDGGSRPFFAAGEPFVLEGTWTAWTTPYAGHRHS